MNLETIAAKAASLIKSEDAPIFGSGTLNIEDDRLFSSLAHLFAIVIWLWKRKESPAVDVHGKEALNMAITWLIVIFPLNIFVAILPSFLGAIFSLVISFLGIIALGLAAYGLLLAREGRVLRYPYNLRLIK